jgi:hypothetical protein
MRSSPSTAFLAARCKDGHRLELDVLDGARQNQHTTRWLAAFYNAVARCSTQPARDMEKIR